jgi:hypothetical protein
MENRMPSPFRLHRLAAAAVLLCSPAVAPAGLHTDWLPADELFSTPIASTAEPLNYLGFSRFNADDDAESFTIALTSLGLSFPIVRVQDAPVGGDWQFGFFAAMQSQFNMDESSDPLINTDYFIGFPLSFRHERWSARARVFHQSSHLGDELLLSGQAPEREDLSYEAADLLIAYTLPAGWRIYAGGAYILSSDLPKIGDASGHGGIDYRSPQPLLWKGRLVLALDTLSSDAFSPDLQIHGLAGLRFGGTDADAAAFTIALQVFDGPVPFGQFFDDAEVFYVGGLMIFDLD